MLCRTEQHAEYGLIHYQCQRLAITEGQTSTALYQTARNLTYQGIRMEFKGFICRLFMGISFLKKQVNLGHLGGSVNWFGLRP